MPFNDSIVTFINQSLKKCLLLDGKFHGISTIIARKKNAAAPLETIPGIFQSESTNRPKEYISIAPDDKEKMIVYHKALTNTYALDKNNSYGDGYNYKCTSEMNMIVWVNGSFISNAEQLESVFIHAMPNRISPELSKELNFINSIITPLSSIMDRLVVFRQEYPQSDFFLKPQHYFFSIRYRIETTYDKRCVDKCLCG